MAAGVVGLSGFITAGQLLPIGVAHAIPRPCVEGVPVLGGVYQVSTPEQLRFISLNSDCLNKSFLQTASIDVGIENWTPIGDLAHNFIGIYDGGGNSVTGLNASTTDGWYQGLFGYIVGATVQNVNVTATMLSTHTTGNPPQSAGALVGYALNSTVSNSRASGTVTSSSYVGGLVGWLSGASSITGSSADVVVTGTSSVGGLVGWNSGAMISNSSASGNVIGETKVGGLVGDMTSNPTITNSYASGKVTGTSAVGGLVGSSDEFTTISASFWDTTTSLTPKGVGNVVSDPVGVAGLPTFKMQQFDTFGPSGANWAIVNGWATSNSLVWGICVAPSGGYPYLLWSVDGPEATCPTVTASAPSSGPLAGGTTITITGTNFLAGATVNVGGTACASVAVLSATSISCDTPPANAGTADFVVTTPGRTATGTALYTYLAEPIVPPIVPPTSTPAGVDHFIRTWGLNYLGHNEKFWLADGVVWHSFDNGATWSANAPMGSPLPTIESSQVGFGLNYLGHGELYVIAGDGNVYHNFATPGQGSGWNGWDPMGHPADVTIVGEVSVARNAAGNQELFVTGSDGAVYHIFSTPGVGNGWSAWSTLGGPAGGVAGGVHVNRNNSDNQELFVVANDGQVYHSYATPGTGSGWSAWSTLGGPTNGVKGDVAVWLNWQGREELFLIDGTGQLVHNWATPGQGSGWSGWSPMSTPAGVTLTGFIGLDQATPLGSRRLYVKDTNANFWYADSITTGTRWTEWTNIGTTPPNP